MYFQFSFLGWCFPGWPHHVMFQLFLNKDPVMHREMFLFECSVYHATLPGPYNGPPGGTPLRSAKGVRSSVQLHIH